MFFIRPALPQEYIHVQNFYYDLIDHMDEFEYKPGWKKGIYPSDAYLRESISMGELFIGILDDRIISAMILNTAGNESYARARWLQPLQNGQYMTIHALGIHPSYKRQGYARKLVDYALGFAAGRRMKALRLDVLKGNVSAESLYLSAGFSHTDTIRMFYEDTGWTDFLLFEYDLVRKKKRDRYL